MRPSPNFFLIESPREFELAERNFISHFSIG